VAYKVSFTLSQLFDAQATALAGVLPNVSLAVQKVAESGSLRWKDAVWKARLWKGEKEPYVESIKWKMIGDYQAVIWCDYAQAQEIETGRPARDLKRMLLTSGKVRAVKNPKSKRFGQRYLIIPFRHNTPGHDALAKDMPADIYGAAKSLSPSFVTGYKMQHNGLPAGAGGKTVRRLAYKWGGRLPPGLAPKLKAEHHSDPYANMVRFNTSTPGGGKSSAYLTFRMMGEWSSGWIVPAKPGLYLARGVADGLQPVLNAMISAAVAASLKTAA